MIRKSVVALVLPLIFTACSNANVTVTSEVTVTLTPSPVPTATKILTPTPSFTPTPEAPLPVGMPEGAVVDNKNGEIRSVDGQVLYRLRENLGWVKEYKSCWVERWRECAVPVEDLFNGEYHKWLKTLSKPFDPTKIRILPLIELSGGEVVYDVTNAPNYEDPETRPFRRNVTSAITTYEGLDYWISPVEYPDPDEPANTVKNVWVIGIMPMSMLGSKLGQPLPAGAEERNIATWLDRMNIAPWVNGTAFPAGVVPLVEKSWQNVGEMEMRERFTRFKEGDTSAFDGLMILISIGWFQDAHWFE